MADALNGTESFDLRCPHCKKEFSAQLISGAAERYRGFKCPHCKLFVPLKRAEEGDLIKP